MVKKQIVVEGKIMSDIMFDLYNQISNLFVEVACLKKENRRLKKQILRGWKKEYK